MEPYLGIARVKTTIVAGRIQHCHVLHLTNLVATNQVRWLLPGRGNMMAEKIQQSRGRLIIQVYLLLLNKRYRSLISTKNKMTSHYFTAFHVCTEGISIYLKHKFGDCKYGCIDR
jgi:hypothetical protein